MGAGCRCLIGQAQDKDRAAPGTVEASIFVQWHGLYPYVCESWGTLLGPEPIRHQSRIDCSGQGQGEYWSAAGLS